MSSFVRTGQKRIGSKKKFIDTNEELPDISEAEAILFDLASVFANQATGPVTGEYFNKDEAAPTADNCVPNLEAKYRALLEQIPAVVFMAYLDRGISEAYVSPEIEAVLGLFARGVARGSGSLVSAYSSG